MTSPQGSEDRADAAISKRLAKLAATPVDTTALDKAIRQQLPSPVKRRHSRRWWISISAAAASLILIASIAFVLLQSREVQASPDMMAQMHEDIVAGRVPTMPHDSIEDANRAIAAMAGNFPRLPQPPAEHTMSCCMRDVGNKKVACVLLNHQSTPVTMVVAAASDMQSPSSPTIVRDGVTYHVKSVGKLNMVMTERESRWICLVSELPTEQLMDIASGIKF